MPRQVLMECEGDVKREVKKLLKKYNAWWYMPVPTGFGKAGVPDFICCIDGSFLAIETKYGSNKPTANQEREIREIKLAGGAALVINEKNLPSLEDTLEPLRWVAEDGECPG
jgi:hypothetical protein